MRRGSCVFFVILCVGLLSTARAGADAVYGKQFQFTQPDGTVVDVRIWGDEYYRVIETLDGYTLTRDTASGYACYAKLSPDKRALESTGLRAGSARPKDAGLEPHLRIDKGARNALILEKRNEAASRLARFQQKAGAKAGPPCAGNVRGIVLLVDFPDGHWTVPRSEIDSYCNTPGYSGNGNNGSVRDYYDAVSDGLFNYTSFVTPTYYRASHSRAYYDDPERDFGDGAAELITEALDNLNASGFDFSQYDSNGDGYVDAINCFYAGQRPPNWSVGLWPHSGSMWYAVDGVRCLSYQITNIGSSLTLGTFCHENGHMVCDWPDLYDYDMDSAGVGNFCLMAYQGSDTNPVEPCAPLKDMAGWATVTDLSAPGTGLPLTAGANAFFRIAHPTLTNEYFMIENRNQAGRDASLPDSGLALWHVDTLGSNDNNGMLANRHFLVTLVQADGRWDLEHDTNAGDSHDLFKAGAVTECSPTTRPNTNWWDGLPSLKRIYAVSAAGATMTFSHGAPVESGLAVSPVSLSQYIGQGIVTGLPIQVRNVMDAPMSYSLAIAQASRAGVFSVTPGTGNSSGEWVGHTVNIDTVGVPFGTYTATVRVSASVPNSPIDVPVSILVGPSLATVLDTHLVQWTAPGVAPWFGETYWSHDGVDAAQSGAIGDMQSGVLSTDVYGPATLSFYWAVSSEEDFDFLRFYIDDVQQLGSISGEVAWELRTFSIGAGAHTIKWVYQKDENWVEGLDAGWVDQVRLDEANCQDTGSCGAPKAFYTPSDELCLSVPCPILGATSFEWSRDGTPLSDDVRTTGAQDRVLNITSLTEEDSGVYSCALHRDGESIGSYVVQVTVTANLPVGQGRWAWLLAAGVAMVGVLGLMRARTASLP